MTRNRIKGLLVLVFMVAGICCFKNQQSGVNSTNAGDSANTVANNIEPPPPCPASADWVNNPQSGPSEVPLGNNAQLCQFYQFSWQWFLAMMNQMPNGTNRNYQNQQQFPQLQASGSCSAANAKPTFFVRTVKNKDNKLGDFVLPEDAEQALDSAIIYDQQGKVVLYEVRFSMNECTLAQTNPTAVNFQSGTIEMKIAYRQISQAETPNYVTINVDINQDGKTDPSELLGMVGFHFVISTPDHPEFIWATFEHKQNVPECQLPPKQNDPAWSFASPQCAAELPNPTKCSFNVAQSPAPTPTPGGGTNPTPTPIPLSGGTPTQICRVYHDSSKPGDHGYATNVFDIDTLNEQMVGPKGIVTKLSNSPLAVLKNYQMVGALWLNQDTTSPSFPNGSDLVNQRGSIQLANSTMETTAQQGFAAPPYTGTNNLQPAANCFACHGYVPKDGNVAVSHIFDDIVAQTKQTKQNYLR